MLFSFTSFLVAQVCASILICIWCIILNKTQLLNRLDLNAWFLFTPLLIVRMILPLEFSYTYTIPSRKILPPIAQFFYSPIKEDSPVEYAHVFIILWLSIAVLIHLYKVMNTRRTYKAIRILISGKEDSRYNAVINQLGYRAIYEKRKIAIVKSNITTSPAIFQFKRPVILLPDLDFSDNELFYILDHEFTHLKNRDVVYLKFVDFLNSLFWWNPFVYLFRKEFSKLLEMRVDHNLMKKYDNQQKAEYLDCILKVYKYQISFQEKDDISKKNAVLLFSRRRESVLKKRLGYLGSGHNRGFSVVITLMFCVVFFVSTCFVVEPDFVVQEVEETSFNIPEEMENYFIYRGNDIYDMYIDGIYMGQVMNADEISEFKDFPIFEE